jgi:hypothetical protein
MRKIKNNQVVFVTRDTNNRRHPKITMNQLKRLGSSIGGTRERLVCMLS